jgi:hypothetical protein
VLEGKRCGEQSRERYAPTSYLQQGLAFSLTHMLVMVDVWYFRNPWPRIFRGDRVGNDKP